MRSVKFIFLMIGALMLGALVSWCALLWVPPSQDLLKIGNWYYSKQVAGPDVGPWDRARTALHGPLALGADEAIYFHRRRDDEGHFLSSHCRYLVKGGKLPSYWWSVTVYDLDGFLPINKSRKYSYTSVEAKESSSWQFTLSRGEYAPDEGEYSLTFRVYGEGLQIKDWNGSELPSIEKQECVDA